MRTYREWITGSLLSNDPKSDLSGIVVLPVLSTKPDYRDVLSGPFQARLGVDTITFGSWLGAPELVLPGKPGRKKLRALSLRFTVGKFPYHSKITDRTEFLPVSVSILGPKGKVPKLSLCLVDILTNGVSGSDLMLINLASAALSKAELPTSLGTGRNVFKEPS